jgi:23S rRNA (adenine2503-C2)-methyltransferase
MAESAPCTDLMELLPEELAEFLVRLGQPAYRARQVFAWLHRGASFAEMSDLPRFLRERLSREARAGTLELAARQVAPDRATKLGLRTLDGHLIETVLMPYARRTTVCVSSQIGCAYGCQFCATGQQGLVRSLRAGEIVAQAVRAQVLARPARVSNVVFMGMGEPLANYDAVLRAVRLLNHPWGLHIAARHIAVSTCGLPEQMRRLAGEGLQLALAVSLHAGSDEVRSQLVPINRRYPIAEVVQAAREYADQTGRKVAFEYVVMPGLNDDAEQARKVAQLLRGMPAMVNLIAQNPTSGEGKRACAEAAAGRPDARAAARSTGSGSPLHAKAGHPERSRGAAAFASLLRSQGLEVAVRRSRGGAVLGACGQLRRSPLGARRAPTRPP